MNISKQLRITACFFTLALCACHKPDLPTQSIYTFHNQTGKKITVDLYNTKEDYNLNTNRATQLVVENGTDEKLNLDIGKTYWIDWYSPDYSFNNWTVSFSEASPAPELKVAAVDDRRDFNPRSLDTIRSVMLNGNGISSYWKGTGVAGTATEGTHEFRFKKDQTCEYTFTSPGGAVSSGTYQYDLYNTSSTGGRTNMFGLGLNDPFTRQTFFIAYCYLNNTGVPTGILTGRDKLRIVPYQGSSSSEFYVQRQ